MEDDCCCWCCCFCWQCSSLLEAVSACMCVSGLVGGCVLLLFTSRCLGRRPPRAFSYRRMTALLYTYAYSGWQQMPGASVAHVIGPMVGVSLIYGDYIAKDDVFGDNIWLRNAQIGSIVVLGSYWLWPCGVGHMMICFSQVRKNDGRRNSSFCSRMQNRNKFFILLIKHIKLTFNNITLVLGFF